jgi:NAD(P)-dependent dehydrogenase (short-subunit alcohol dehydrogenase family)
MPGADGGHELIGTDLADIRDVVETNYFGALRVARAFAPIPAGNGGGALVGIHSVLSWVAGWGHMAARNPPCGPQRTRCESSWSRRERW